MAYRFAQDEKFNFEIQLALGQVQAGAGDVGEILSTTARVIDGDAESWFTEWTRTAERVRALAGASAARGHQVSARQAYLRAAAYYGTALSVIDGTEDVSRLVPTFRVHRACFDEFAFRLDPPALPVEIPYEETVLPGYLFVPPNEPAPRPTLVVNNGSDGPITSAWSLGAAGGLARGYNVLLFDGPGQQSMLFLHGVPFRPDWERVLTPVVDFLCARPEVDAGGIVLIGVSQAGYWVPRALAFEHRFAAAVADPGVFDASTSWLRNLPDELLALLDGGERELFDRVVAEEMSQATPQERQELAWRAKPYGIGSLFDLFTEVRGYTLAGVAERITTPLLITDPEGEQFWPRQSRRLFDALTGPRELVAFTAAEGADGHCEPMARSLADQRIFDWFAERLPG
ncbi:alpha/beta hydrolase family protein [Nonomuraea mangrovi]|uniref:Alpha/beta hydrolase family protein n=1 Tax=Nonomuraea mangrovi TaxID=2316207 RepID=A0ABW4T137_9ACTN